MNKLESCTTLNPYNKTDECAKFTVGDISQKFSMDEILTPGQIYTLSFWLRSDAEGYVQTAGTEFCSSPEWTRCVQVFTPNITDLNIVFRTCGTYYIYHSQLEIGNKATDWERAPEDVEDDIYDARAEIQILEDSLKFLVTDAEGNSSMMKQEGGGWTFNIGPIQSQLNIAEDKLKWVQVTTYDNEPCIALGANDSEFKMYITNTKIQFMQNGEILAYMSNQALNIKKAIIEEELWQDDFVWKSRTRADGSKNLGLIWKGV